MALTKLLLQTYAAPTDKIFDPFMGTGTTAVACAEFGLEWSGCEIDEKWINVANKRLISIQPDMFGIQHITTTGSGNLQQEIENDNS